MSDTDVTIENYYTAEVESLEEDWYQNYGLV